MQYINNVSTIGVGCMRFKDLSQDQLYELITTALDHGINFFDHADIYGKGFSETHFGHVLSSHPELRDKMFIQSKCAIHDGLYDFSKEYILQSVDGILERLQTDHIDSLLLHRPDVLMELEEVKEAFDILEASGKVLHFGVSNMNRYQMELLQSGINQKLFANQLQLSLAHTPIIDAYINVNRIEDNGIMREAGSLEYTRMNDVILQTWSPIQSSKFKETFINHPEYKELNDLLEQLAQKYHVEKDTIAYAWLLRLPTNVQVITGTTNKQRIIHAAKASDITLTRQEWYNLYKAVGNKLP